MNDHSSRKRLNRILNDLATELDVPPSKYREAQRNTTRLSALGWTQTTRHWLPTNRRYTPRAHSHSARR